MLKKFYDQYESAPDKTKLNNEKLKSLLEFQTYLFDKGLIDRNRLQFQGNKLVQTEENLRRFHFRLLAFFLHHVKNEVTASTEPFLSIQMYFSLQEKGIISYQEGSRKDIPSDFLRYKDDYSFKQRKKWLKNIIQAEQARHRETFRLHEKFLRLKKPSKLGSQSSQLIQQIEGRINRNIPLDQPIVIDNYSARSVIIALHKTMKKLIQQLSNKKVFDGRPLYFQIGDTLIRWLPANNHSRVFIEMNYWNVSKTRKLGARESKHPNKKTLHSFPYESELTQLLSSLENKLNIPPPRNLMALISQKFSNTLQAFTAAEFNGASVEEIHFLNAFCFLIQIVENARYLEDKVDTNRNIENQPISIALAVSKALRKNQQLTWEELYSKAPGAFKQGKKAYKNSAVDDNSFGGLDAVSGKSLRENYLLVSQKVDELSVKHPGHLSNISSANAIYGFLKDAYGSGDESDSDNDSVISLMDEQYLNQKKYETHLSKHLKPIRFAGEGYLKPSIEEDTPSLYRVARDAGYMAVEAGGGGNCFFHAVVHQLNHLHINHQNHNHESLRAGALDYVLNNWSAFSDFILDPDDFVMRMSTTGEWADHEIIAATTLMLGINIRIYRNDGEDPNFVETPNANHEISLGYYVGVHYVSFVQQETTLSLLAAPLTTFFQSAEYLSKHRHDSQEAQHEYDKAFGLVLRQ